MVYNDYADDLVAPDELAINQPSYGAEITDRNGTAALRVRRRQVRSAPPDPARETSQPAFLAATIATEDNSFFTNPGINIEWSRSRRLGEQPVSGSGDVFEGSRW